MSEVIVLDAAAYFMQRKRTIDAHVQGEHKWLGDTSEVNVSPSMYMHVRPWYMSADTTAVAENTPVI